MPNLRDWTVTEIMVMMPQARNVLAKHFGPEGIGTASGFRLRDLARRDEVDLNTVVKDLQEMAKATGTVF